MVPPFCCTTAWLYCSGCRLNTFCLSSNIMFLLKPGRPPIAAWVWDTMWDQFFYRRMESWGFHSVFVLRRDLGARFAMLPACVQTLLNGVPPLEGAPDGMCTCCSAPLLQLAPHSKPSSLLRGVAPARAAKNQRPRRIVKGPLRLELHVFSGSLFSFSPEKHYFDICPSSNRIVKRSSLTKSAPASSF